jgi:hypothetical protein
VRWQLSLWFVLIAGCSYDAIRVIERQDAAMREEQDGGGLGLDAEIEAEVPHTDASADTGTDELGDGGDRDGGSDAGDGDASDGDAGGGDAGDAAMVPETPNVVPAFATATRWTDRVRSEDLSAECHWDDNMDACFHAGEQRAVEVPELSTCDGLTAYDSQGWYDWTCAVDGSAVRMLSGNLRKDVRLLDLLDVGGGKWRSNVVTVKQHGTPRFQTEAAPFWSNPVERISGVASNTVVQLDDAYTVYILDDASAQYALQVAQDHVSLVLAEGASMTSIASKEPLIEAAGREHLWIEGGTGSVLHAGDHDTAAVDIDSNFAVLRSLTVQGVAGASSAAAVQLRLQGAHVADIVVRDASGVGLRLLGDRVEAERLTVDAASATCAEASLVWSQVLDVRVEDCGGHGLRVFDTTGLVLTGLDVVRAGGGQGLRAESVSESAFNEVSVVDGADDGVLATQSVSAEETKDTSFVGVRAYGNAGHGVALEGADLRLLLATSAANDGDGIRLHGRGHVLMHSTTAMNIGTGLVADGLVGATLVNFVATGNATGLHIAASSERVRVHDALITDNDADITVLGDANVFSGLIEVTSASSCTVAAGLSEPGLSDNPCEAIGESTAEIASPQTTVDALGGRVTTSDSINPHTLDAADTVAFGSITSWEFSTPLRFWGRDAGYGTAAARGRCSGGTCGMWDLRPHSIGPLADPIELVVGELNRPEHVLLHTWSAVSSSACGWIQLASWDEPTGKCTAKLLSYAFSDTGTAGNTGLCAGYDFCFVARNRGSHCGAGGALTLFSALVVPDFRTLKLMYFPDGAL